MPADAHTYICAIVLMSSVGASVSTLEWIHERHHFEDGGLCSWPVLSTRSKSLGTGFFAEILSAWLRPGHFVGLLLLRLAALACLPISLWVGRGFVVFLGIVLGTSLVMHLRLPLGLDGSDRMMTQIFGGLFLGQLGGTPLAFKVSLWFIAAQVSLSYLTAGLAKALSKEWRQGHAVGAILNTRTHGYEPVARFLFARPKFGRLMSWGAVAMECGFPLALVVGFPGCLVFLLWGAVFHLINAAIMGLNSFFWSFLSTYPAVIYCAVIWHQHSSV